MLLKFLLFNEVMNRKIRFDFLFLFFSLVILHVNFILKNFNFLTTSKLIEKKKKKKKKERTKTVKTCCFMSC